MSQDLAAPGRLRIGINVRDVSDPKFRMVAESDAEGNAFFEQYSNDVSCPTLNTAKARGTALVPANVAQEDRLVDILATPYSSGFMSAGNIRCFVDAPVSSGQRPATRWQIETNENNAAARLVVYVSREGYMGIGSAFSPSVTARRAAYPLHVVGSVAGAKLYVTAESYDNAQDGAFRMGRARGSFAAPATVVTGDSLGAMEFFAYTNQWHECAEVAAVAEGVIVAGTRPDSRLLLNTSFGGNLLTRVQVLSGGTVLVGPVAAAAGDTSRLVHIVRPTDGFAPLRVQVTGGGGSANVLRLDGGDNAVTGSLFAAFHRPDGTQIGSISQNGAGSVAFNTTSDARLKENVSDLEAGALAVLNAIRVRNFNYIGDPGRVVRTGFIAQELHSVYPGAVKPGGGAPCACDLQEGGHVDGCANLAPWSVDYTGLIPLIVKAIQELQG